MRGGSKNRVTSVRSEVNSVGSTSSPRGISPLSPLLFSLLTTFPLTFSRWLLTRLPRAIIRVRIAHALNDGNGRKNESSRRGSFVVGKQRKRRGNEISLLSFFPMFGRTFINNIIPFDDIFKVTFQYFYCHQYIYLHV